MLGYWLSPFKLESDDGTAWYAQLNVNLDRAGALALHGALVQASPLDAELEALVSALERYIATGNVPVDEVSGLDPRD